MFFVIFYATPTINTVCQQEDSLLHLLIQFFRNNVTVSYKSFKGNAGIYFSPTFPLLSHLPFFLNLDNKPFPL